MQKTIVTILLLGSAVAGFAQGTVAFSYGGVEIFEAGRYVPVPTTPGLINYGLFYGIGATQPATLTFLSTTHGVNSTVMPGGIASAYDGVSPIGVLPIPGTQPGEPDVWLQVKGWTASFGTDWVAAEEAAKAPETPSGYFGETAVINALPLGPSTGPGAALWQTASGTNPQKFNGLVLFHYPEPSSMTLFGLGLAGVLVFRRGSYRFKQ